jgi:hypothetical protein
MRLEYQPIGTEAILRRESCMTKDNVTREDDDLRPDYDVLSPLFGDCFPKTVCGLDSLCVSFSPGAAPRTEFGGCAAP